MSLSFWLSLVGFGVLGLMLLVIRSGAKKEGKLEVANEAQKEVIENVEQANRVRRAIHSLPADKKRELLKSKWAKPLK